VAEHTVHDLTGIDYIIDAHHHLWDLDAMRHTWLAERGVTRFFGDPAPIQRPYHVHNFRADVGKLPVTGSVVVQCGVEPADSLLETHWVANQAEHHDWPTAIVSFCDLTSPSREAALDAHQAHSALRGIRQIVGRDAREDARLGTNALLESPDFAEGLRSLVTRNLSFDLQLTPALLRPAAKLFGRIDALPVALCHAGSPQDLSREGLRDWQQSLREFAALPNAICKLSGFGMFDQSWTPDSLRDRILRAIDTFGPTRCAFGSNFPVDKLYATYEATLGAYLDVTADFTNEERHHMFAGVAERFYNFKPL